MPAMDFGFPRPPVGIYPPPSDAGECRRQHLMGLGDDANQSYYEFDTRKFSTVRFTGLSTVAPDPSGWYVTYVTCLLILENGGAVEIHMGCDNPREREILDTRGQLVWREWEEPFERSVSEDFVLVEPAEVGDLYRAIRYVWTLHRYRFAPGGIGSAFWK